MMTARGPTAAAAAPVMGPADAGFVAGLTAIVLPIVQEPERERMLLSALTDLRPRLGAAPQILGMALCFDALCVGARTSGEWRREIEEMRRRLISFNEWRLGRAQDALKRR